MDKSELRSGKELSNVLLHAFSGELVAIEVSMYRQTMRFQIAHFDQQNKGSEFF